MQIAVLSGKGGTGKTFVSVNLAYAKGKSVYIDCDVEEPNGRLFLKPQVKLLEKVYAMIPSVDDNKCTGCRKCVELCKFNALASIKNKLLVFPELCHACKGCVMLCPQKALTESGRYIGLIEHGVSGEIEVITGVLNTGEATGVPIIRKLLSRMHGEQCSETERPARMHGEQCSETERPARMHGEQSMQSATSSELPKDSTVIVDCPPGSACSVMESIKDSDFCLMVAEPTVFGIHNLDMVYRLVKLFGKPHALVVNKDIGDRSLIDKYCSDNDIRIIAYIPYDSELATVNSKGIIAAQEYVKYLEIFKGVLDTVEQEVCHEAACNTKR